MRCKAVTRYDKPDTPTITPLATPPHDSRGLVGSRTGPRTAAAWPNAAPPLLLTSPSLVSRRALLRAGVATAAASLLSACVLSTGRNARAAPPPCLAPVDVDDRRLIRSVVGLRPYRAAGFVVRMDVLGTKRLVHNYGHGGAGITLSWGTARLAADLGLVDHDGPVAVLGAGVIGLTMARLVQEAGFPVTVYAATLPPNTTSDIAGGQWHPFGHYEEREVTPQWHRQFAAAADYSWRRFQIMIGDDYGIRWLPTYTQTRGNTERRLTATFPPVNRLLEPAENPFPAEHVVRYDTLYMEPSRLLRQLLRDIHLANGRVVVRRFAAATEIADLPEPLVFNCTGLGARELFGDTELRPARGQLAVLLPQPEVTYAYTLRAGSMFPRSDGIILGGTFELDNWSLDVDAEATQRILASHKTLRATLRC